MASNHRFVRLFCLAIVVDDFAVKIDPTSGTVRPFGLLASKRLKSEVTVRSNAMSVDREKL